MADTPLPPAIPAATLIVLREGADGAPPDILFVERASSMAFAAGMLVFPGGRIDPGDHDLAVGAAGDPDDAAARVAAIRETWEEAGLPVGLVATPDAGAVESVRRSLHAGTSFADALAAIGAVPTPDALIPFARWRPAHRDLRIYDTRFYLARLPADAPAASVDATENVRLFWASAAVVLADCDAGTARVIYPTRRVLERLAQHATIAAVEADARAWPIGVVTPWVERRGDADWLCIPDGIGYPITAEPLTGARRG